MKNVTKLDRARTAARNLGTKLAIGGTALAASVPAFAQDFDGADVTAKIATYVAVGVAILAAMALGRWTLKALGIVGGR